MTRTIRRRGARTAALLAALPAAAAVAPSSVLCAATGDDSLERP